MKLGLGTAQFGMNYGVSNKNGQTDSGMVAEILALAKKKHIQLLDTAPLYGSSEEVLGSKLSPDHGFKIVTKTIKIQSNHLTFHDAQAIKNSFYRSLNQLKQSHVYGLLLHHPHDLLVPGGEYLYDELLKLKENKLVEKIGVSIYNGFEIDQLLEKYSLDLFQLPISIFDQRLLQHGYLSQLKKEKIEIHARSVFLQGLLLMPLQEIPAYFSPILSHIARYQEIIQSKQLTLLRAALGFVLGMKEIDGVICGVNNQVHLEELLTANVPLACEQFEEFQVTEEKFINPSQWKLQ